MTETLGCKVPQSNLSRIKVEFPLQTKSSKCIRKKLVDYFKEGDTKKVKVYVLVCKHKHERVMHNLETHSLKYCKY